MQSITMKKKTRKCYDYTECTSDGAFIASDTCKLIASAVNAYR